MGRPRLRVGAHGTFKTKKIADKSWEASTYVRDDDGHRRRVRRTATTKGAAEDKLQLELAERTRSGRELTESTLINEVAARWLRSFREMVDTGERAPNTLRVYECVLSAHVLPGLGALTAREATVTRLDAFIVTTRKKHGASVSKTARCVLNGIMGYAVRHGALKTNPVRDVSRVPAAPKRKPRALTEAERNEWLAAMERDEQAVDRDLPDLTRFLLATGVRIGEALAVSFMEVDFAESTVSIDYNLVRIKGRGLRRMRTKSRAGERTLKLPSWAMTMLGERYARLGEGPVFPSMRMLSWRDPSNTAADFREARDLAGFSWVTPHVFRKTVATILDEAGMSGREIANQMGHSKISMTQDVYMGREATTERHAEALEGLVRGP